MPSATLRQIEEATEIVVEKNNTILADVPRSVSGGLVR